MKSRVKENLVSLQLYHRSMTVALDKAERDSEVEDMYFLEKLIRTANCMGYKMVRDKELDI